MAVEKQRLRSAVNHWLRLCAGLISGWLISLLLLSYLLPQDLTRTGRLYAVLVQVSFFGRVLSFHIALLLCGLAAISLMLRSRKLFLFNAIVATWLLACTLPRFWPHDISAPPGATLRLMSMNLKYTHAHAELFIDQVHQYKPDVLVIQDYTPYAETELKTDFAGDYPYRYLKPNTLQGLAIFSRLPFAGPRPESTFSKTRRQLRAVVKLNDRPIVIYVEHPYSPRNRQRIINNRLATADLIAQVEQETDPVIVAGDFNFTTETPNEQAIKQAGFTDCFEQSGRGRGSTWPVEPTWLQWLPGVRIDHIFISRQFSSTRCFVGSYDGSDHLPLVADLVLRAGR